MNLLELFQSNPSVCTDTRKIKKGDLFFALKGANFNGNMFAEKALEAGASAVVVDEAAFYQPSDSRYVLVDDTLFSLQELSRERRKALGVEIFGLTGSNGKTTTKELLASVLEQEKKIFATKGNFNNHIGVPLTLLDIPEDAELAIVEMGANQPGDIKELAEIALPNMGLLTNVGHAHLEKLGSLDGVRKTKGALFDFVGGKGGKIFVNVADHRVKQAASPYGNQITYGTKEADYHADILDSKLGGMKIKAYGPRWKKGLSLESRLSGAYNVMNILAAVAVGDQVGISPKGIQEGIYQYISTNNRSQVVELGKLKIWLDAYNANPSSMEASIHNIFQSGGQAIGLILGDMFELGEKEAEMHAELGSYIQQFQPKLLVGVGPRMQHMVDRYQGGAKLWVSRREDLQQEFAELVKGLDTLLIKGSRSMAMEKLMDALTP